jgi:hypothetical protein
MYAINDNLIENINIIMNNSNVNYNLTNIYNETSLHLLLKKYNLYLGHKNIIEKLIINTDLNIQDNNGKTCLAYIIDYNILEFFHTILETKKLNLFIYDNNNIAPYDFIKNDPLKINIIINSFYFNLIKNKKMLIIDWEKKCANNELQKNNDNECKKIIKDIILTQNRSIPMIDDYNLVLDSGIFVNSCFYTGAPIDVLFGLLFLYNKFKNKELNIICDYPLTINKELETYLTSLGINYNYKLDFCNFEIMWSFQKMIIPTYFDHDIKIKIKNSKIIIIPIGIETNLGAHANILFYDVTKKIIERFEPNGFNAPIGLNYNHILLDKLLEIKFKKIDPDIKFIKPSDYLPFIGFQMLENFGDNTVKRIGDPNGFCGVWCIWWIYHKLKNLTINSKDLAIKLIKEIKFKNINFKILIRNFSKNISDLRDSFLIKYDLDINYFMAGNYNPSILNNLEKDIINFIY